MNYLTFSGDDFLSHIHINAPSYLLIQNKKRRRRRRVHQYGNLVIYLQKESSFFSDWLSIEENPFLTLTNTAALVALLGQKESINVRSRETFSRKKKKKKKVTENVISMRINNTHTYHLLIHMNDESCMQEALVMVLVVTTINFCQKTTLVSTKMYRSLACCRILFFSFIVFLAPKEKEKKKKKKKWKDKLVIDIMTLG